MCAEQAWRVPHPPKRGRWWLASRPLVHRGFFMTWTANGLNRQSPSLHALPAEKAQALQLRSACLRHSDIIICLLATCSKLSKVCSGDVHMLFVW